MAAKENIRALKWGQNHQPTAIGPPTFPHINRILWAKGSPSVQAATIPCWDRALYFHTGRWIFRRWATSGTLPRIAGSRQAIWFHFCPLSPELTLYPQKEPWSRELVLFIWSLRKLWWFYQPWDLYIQFSLSIFSVERNIIKSSCFLVSLTPGGKITVLKGFFQ